MGPTVRADQGSYHFLDEVHYLTVMYGKKLTLPPRFRTDIPSTTTFALATFDGGVNTQGAADAGIEANLGECGNHFPRIVVLKGFPDIQYTVGLATSVPVTFVSGGENFADGALEVNSIRSYFFFSDLVRSRVSWTSSTS